MHAWLWLILLFFTAGGTVGASAAPAAGRSADTNALVLALSHQLPEKTIIDAVAIDEAGRYYLAGRLTYSSGMVTPKLFSPSDHTAIFAAKLDPAGKLLWLTVAGETDFGGRAYSVAALNDGGLALGGAWRSSVAGVSRHVAVFDPSGNLKFSRVLAGDNTPIFVAGIPGTNDVAFLSDSLPPANPDGLFPGPGTPGALQVANRDGRDVAFGRFKADGSPVFLSWFGGTGSDWPGGIAALADGSLVIAGISTSSDLGVSGAKPGDADAFLAHIDPSGSRLLNGRFYGGSRGETGAVLAVNAGTVWLAGSTQSTDLEGAAGKAQPASAGANDAFVARFALSDFSLQAATYLGGGKSETVLSLAVEPASGSVWLLGTTPSQDFPWFSRSPLPI